MAYLIIVLCLILIYTFYMGFNDGANAIATTVATRALSPRFAIFYAAIFKLIAPIVMFFLGAMAVAETIKNDIVQQEIFGTLTAAQGFVFLTAGLLAAIVWGMVTFISHLPNSSSHTLLGGIVGGSISVFGWGSIQWGSVFIKVILMVILAPIIGLILGYVFMWLLKKIMSGARRSAQKKFVFLERLNVAFLASFISINNVQKSLGVALIAFSIFYAQPLTTTVLLPMTIAFAMCLSIGLIFGGYRLVNTIGNKIYKMGVSQAFISQLSTGVVVITASLIGIPVSTGQITSSSIMGVGMQDRFVGVKWVTAKRILFSWFITFPAAMILGLIFGSVGTLFL